MGDEERQSTESRKNVGRKIPTDCIAKHCSLFPATINFDGHSLLGFLLDFIRKIFLMSQISRQNIISLAYFYSAKLTVGIQVDLDRNIGFAVIVFHLLPQFQDIN